MLRVYFLLLDIQKAVPSSKHNQFFWLLARLSLSLSVCVCSAAHHTTIVSIHTGLVVHKAV